MAYDPPIKTTNVPAWLIPPDRPGELTEYSWEIVILPALARGDSLKSIIDEIYPEPKEGKMEYGRILRWIHKDPEREALYHEAQKIGTEALVEEMIDVANGENSLEDVQRSTLRVNTYKWIISQRNRDRYGDVKKVDHNVTVDIGKAIEAANARVENAKVIDAEVVDDD